MNKKVRVRIAPSPTGIMHVGTLRTALYNYLFAKKQGGDFILRIEDTDQKRFVPGTVENLIQTLELMGIRYTEGPFEKSRTPQTSFAQSDSETYPGIVEVGDYGPYVQSERLDLYKKHADELIANKKAYYCFCSPERLDQIRTEQAKNKQAPKYDRHCRSLSEEETQARLNAKESYVVRMMVPDDREITFTDLVRGAVKFHTRDVDDQVILKSDGFPTYHLAAIVDDHLMGITHVLRSEEWLPSTPKHILLYESFGWNPPEIGHVSFILGKDGKKKLSKRDGGATVEYFLSLGYLEEALLNFLVLLGWNPGKGNTQEIFSLEELEKMFDISGLHKAGAVFDLKKLDWLNGEYIKRLSRDELYNRALPFLEGKVFFQEWSMEHGAWSAEERSEYLKRMLVIEQDRLAKLSDVGEQNLFFFVEDLSYDPKKLCWKENTAEMTKESLSRAKNILTEISPEDWLKKEILEKVLMDAAGEKRGDFLWPIRFALTGADKSPSPFDCAWVLGKKESLKRLNVAIAKL
ncbi:MAG: glutamate--tRNA ligase [Candidatus Moraniibacteriota bacterium]